MKNFVDTNWLRGNMEKEDIVILDARANLKDPEEGLKEYKKSHILGAQFVSLEETMTGKVKKHGGRHPLPDLEDFRDNMSKLGIGNSSTVIVYDNGCLDMAGRLWWMLKYIGLEKVYILGGGFPLWKIKNYPITDEIYQSSHVGDLSLNIKKDMIAEIHEVKRAIESKNKVIIDSRAENRFSGEFEPFDRIPGHIPNAINIPWTNILEIDNCTQEEVLKEYFKDLKKYDELIVHCGSGITGTVNILFMEEIGLKPKLYVGGYSDWVSYEDNKVISDF